MSVGAQPLHLLLEENSGLDLNHGVVEWIHSDGSKSKQSLRSVLGNIKQRSPEHFDNCFFKGNVSGRIGSLGKDVNDDNQNWTLTVFQWLSTCARVSRATFRPERRAT